MEMSNKRGFFFDRLKHAFYFLWQIQKARGNKRCFIFAGIQRAKRSLEGVRLSLTECSGLTAACHNRLANANASSFKSVAALSPSGQGSEGYFTSGNIDRFIRLFPTWRRADRERLKFLVRHREWDNMMAGWQQPESGRQTLRRAEEAYGKTAEVVWNKPTASRRGEGLEFGSLLVASISLGESFMKYISYNSKSRS